MTHRHWVRLLALDSQLPHHIREWRWACLCARQEFKSLDFLTHNYPELSFEELLSLAYDGYPGGQW